MKGAGRSIEFSTCCTEMMRRGTVRMLPAHRSGPMSRITSTTKRSARKIDKRPYDAMNEANARYHNNTGTMPLQTLPHPSASGTMVRPMTAETPQENAVRPDRPLGQQLPDAMPSAASTSPNQERAKQAVAQDKPLSPPPSPQRPVPTRSADVGKDKEE
jgi:hypothetical protein